jgi:hypothetical protein
MSAAPRAQLSEAPEARSGLDAWGSAPLPAPPDPRGLGWLAAVGPGVIILGASIGSGEFLLGPAAFVRYGLTVLWIAGVAIVLQTLFNQELMRYTLATGEPITSGFMRTRPSATGWAWVYALLYFAQLGWPAWAGAAAGAVFFLASGRIAGPEDAEAVYGIGIAGFLVCVAVLLVGRRVERTLEILNWVLVAGILSALVVLCAIFVSGATFAAALAGFVGYDPAQARFVFVPPDVDFFQLGAFAGYCGAGGVVNLTLSNWARDRGYGMGGATGFIPSLVGGSKTRLAHSGLTFRVDAENLQRWRGWWRVIRADQWGVFGLGAFVGMVLPGLLYVTFLPAGTDIRGYGIAAELAASMSARATPFFGAAVALIGVWILFKSQLDILDGTVRGITDILWTGSARLRAWRDGDVRWIYYGVLAAVVVWGMLALRLAQPIFLLQLSANMGAVVFVIASLHVLRVNTRLLPEPLRPSLGRRIALIAMALFYGAFVTAWVWGLVLS